LGVCRRRLLLPLGVGKKRVRRVMKLYRIKPYKRCKGVLCSLGERLTEEEVKMI
jgi:hypothetical protein